MIPEMNQTGAIVIGGHFHGLGLSRALWRKGIRVVLLDHQPCISRFSRSVWQYYTCPEPESMRFVPFLENLAVRRGLAGWTVFPTDDETVFSLSRNKTRLEPLLRPAVSPWRSIRYMYNKRDTYRMAAKLEIPVPATWYPASEEELAGMPVLFPAIVKPAVMRPFFKKTGQKVFPAQDMSGLIEAYRRACRVIPGQEILIQEVIPEASRYLYSFCPFFRDGRVVASITARRWRQHPMDFGHASTYAETMEIPEIEKLSVRFLRQVRYEGLCEMEFVRDPRDRQFKFLEANPRIWGWHSLAPAAGVNLPWLYFRNLTGTVLTPPVSFLKHVKWIRLVTDVPTALSEMIRGRLTMTDYMKTFQGNKTFAVWSREDPLPFWGELMMLPFLWFTRGF